MSFLKRFFVNYYNNQKEEAKNIITNGLIILYIYILIFFFLFNKIFILNLNRIVKTQKQIKNQQPRVKMNWV